jgi:hypothetical protein
LAYKYTNKINYQLLVRVLKKMKTAPADLPLPLLRPALYLYLVARGSVARGRLFKTTRL